MHLHLKAGWMDWNLRLRKLCLLPLFAFASAHDVGHGTGLAQEVLLPESVAVISSSPAPFAVGGSSRKELPPRDCLRCFGPAACPPRNSCSHGFLYYGSPPCNNGFLNSFCKCGSGNCGNLGVTLSTAWIQLHNWRERPLASRPSAARRHNAPCSAPATIRAEMPCGGDSVAR
jgi:hypothetical protein